MHGTADGIVAKVNGDQIVAQWLKTNTLVLGAGAIDPVVSQAGNVGYPFTRFVHKSKTSGASVIEQYVVDGLGHAWPGGKDGGSYSDAKGPSASALIWAFFKGRTRAAPLDVPPVVIPPPGTSPDGGPPGTNLPGATPGDPAAAPPTAAPADNSAGCGVSRASRAGGVTGMESSLLGAGALFSALAIRRARRRGR